MQLEDLENSEESSSSSQSQSGSIEKKEEIEPTEKTMAIASPDDGNGDTPMEQTNDLTKFNSGRSDKGEVKDTGTPVDDYENVYDNNDNINPNSQPVGLKADVITQDSASTGVKT